MDQVTPPSNIRPFPTRFSTPEDEAVSVDHTDPNVQRGILAQRVERLHQWLSLKRDGQPMMALNNPVVQAEMRLVRQAIELVEGTRDTL